MQVTVNITGDKEELARLSKLGTGLTDFGTAMRRIGDEVVRYYSSQAFASQGGVYGNQWKALSPSYSLWKAKHYPGRGINVRTGTTQRSFSAHTNSNSAVVSNSSDVFKYLQLGTKNMPSRPMMDVNADIKNTIRDIIQQDIQQKILRAG